MIGRREFIAWVLLILITSYYAFFDFGPSPYRNVEVVSVSATSDRIDFVANFEKTDCEFRRLNVVGNSLGIIEHLVWSDPVRGDRQDLEDDREEGDQTLTLRIEADASQYSWIEIRTRHFCPDPDGKSSEFDDRGNETRGEYVYRVFHRIDPREI